MKETIEQIIDVQVEFIFESVAEEMNLEYGDITPNQTSNLDKIKESLNNLVCEWVKNNKQ